MAMTINRLITIIALLCIALGASAKKKREYPCAEIKVGYNYHHKFLRGGDGVIEKNTGQAEIPVHLLKLKILNVKV